MRFTIATIFAFLLVAWSTTETMAFTISPPPPSSSSFTRKKASSSTIPQMTASSTTHLAPVFDEVCETTGVTLTRFMSEVSLLNPEIQELTTLFGAIDTACKATCTLVKRSQLPSSQEALGYGGSIDAGEETKKSINEILQRAMRFTGKLGVLASEEEENPIDMLSTEAAEIIFDESERYVVVFDPLDGSSNVNAGIPSGIIMGIYEHDAACAIVDDCLSDDECTEQEAQCLANTLQPGTNLVAAAYCLFSSSTFLTLTLGNGVYIFTLDEQIGEFVLSKPQVQIPESSNIISFNEARINKWDEPMRKTLLSWREGKGRSGKKFTSRYVGSMVADVHRTLLYGGVFGSPADTERPDGKLHLLYEAAPISYIVEQAGGLSTTGEERVMEITPQVVHQRTPVVMGSRNDVQEVMDAYAASA